MTKLLESIEQNRGDIMSEQSVLTPEQADKVRAFLAMLAVQTEPLKPEDQAELNAIAQTFHEHLDVLERIAQSEPRFSIPYNEALLRFTLQKELREIVHGSL